MTMQHFVLTRFNTASPGRELGIRNTPGWLDRRFDLFERYCLPSVTANVRHDFHWLVYFDEATPEHFRSRIVALQGNLAFEALFVRFLDKAQVINHVSQRLRGDAGRVLTTRLDNDDAVARDFLARVFADAQERQSGTVLNYPNGLALRRGQLFSARDTSNPFTSLVEDAADLRTIWSAKHHELGRRWALVQIETTPMWLQVVHGDNVSNRIKGCRREAAVMEAFAIQPDAPIRSPGSVTLVTDRTILYPLRRLREGAIRLVKRLGSAIRRERGD